MKKERIGILISAVTIIFLAGAIFCGSATKGAAAEAYAAEKASAEKVYKFRIQTIQAAYPAPEGSGLPDPFNYWAEMVREATNGRINIEIYGAGSLVPVADIAASGTIPIQ